MIKHKLVKLGWSYKDIWRFPLVYLFFYPRIIRNYNKRQKGLWPDRWYWADRLILSWGYFVTIDRSTYNG